MDIPVPTTEARRFADDALRDVHDGIEALHQRIRALETEQRAVFYALVPECPAFPGRPNACDPDVCDCTMGPLSVQVRSVIAQRDAGLRVCLSYEADLARLRAVPSGHGTSEETLEELIVAVRRITADNGWFSLCSPADRSHLRSALDAIRDRYARDHGLLTREEVERRARAWACQPKYCFPEASVVELVSALTSPAPGGPNG